MAGNGGGFRMTRARTEVLAELERSHDHPTAAEVYGAVRKRLPAVSLATVYRALDALVDQGRVRAIEEAGGRRRFDATLGEHYHVVCRRCGRVDDVVLRSRVSIDRTVLSACGYSILGHRLCFTGLCPSCQGKTRGRTVTPTGRRER